jgi:hypothetical protein
MSCEVKVYKVKDFIRINKGGQLDVDRSKKIVRELVATASFHGDHNILIDLRGTKVVINHMDELLEVVVEFARFKALFRNKIASVIPDDEERISFAEKFKAILVEKGFDYSFFTDFESAIEWLSDTRSLNPLQEI